jgi:hypothetical protein
MTSGIHTWLARNSRATSSCAVNLIWETQKNIF